jgi:hypothetical protein
MVTPTLLCKVASVLAVCGEMAQAREGKSTANTQARPTDQSNQKTAGALHVRAPQGSVKRYFKTWPCGIL